MEGHEVGVRWGRKRRLSKRGECQEASILETGLRWREGAKPVRITIRGVCPARYEALAAQGDSSFLAPRLLLESGRLPFKSAKLHFKLAHATIGLRLRQGAKRVMRVHSKLKLSSAPTDTSGPGLRPGPGPDPVRLGQYIVRVVTLWTHMGRLPFQSAHCHRRLVVAPRS